MRRLSGNRSLTDHGQLKGCRPELVAAGLAPTPPNCYCLQGLADTFIILGMPFDSPQATQLNKEIFECIYYTALKVSCELAQQEGA